MMGSMVTKDAMVGESYPSVEVPDPREGAASVRVVVGFVGGSSVSPMQFRNPKDVSKNL
jgi:hypothetical protein